MTEAVNKTWKYYDIYLRTQKKKNSCSKFTKATFTNCTTQMSRNCALNERLIGSTFIRPVSQMVNEVWLQSGEKQLGGLWGTEWAISGGRKAYTIEGALLVQLPIS